MKSIFALLGTLMFPLVSFGQFAAGGGDESYAFSEKGRPVTMSLSQTEICEVDARGRLQVHEVVAGSGPVLQQAGVAEDGKFLVFYPQGKLGVESERRILRTRYLVKLRPGVNLADVCDRCDIPAAELKYEAEGLAVCEEESSAKVLSQLQVVAADRGVETVEPLLARLRTKKVIPADPLFTEQWHLRDFGSVPGIDVNVVTAWDLVTGAGVTVGIVDDGILYDHEDLEGNYDDAIDHNWNTGTPDDGYPFFIDETHGTAVAGILAAEWNNGLGGAGVAPDAEITSLRLIADPVDDLDESEALGWMTNTIDISNNSWGPDDFVTDLEGPGPLTRAALLGGVTTGRGGLGEIYVWNAGNGAENNDNSNYDGYANSPYTIAVGAVSNEGIRASYSERGANLVVAAPSDGGTLGITTTSFDVDFATGFPIDTYIDDFGGTSAAVPMVSGVVALMLERNPGLGWRDVQEILMRSAVTVDPSNGDWFTNAAGLDFNHQYGAGMVNARAAVDLATGWTNLGARTSQTKTIIPVAPIPDGDGNSYIATFDFSANPNLRVEHVVVTPTLIHNHRADMDVVLISPNGMQSTLAQQHTNSTEQSISGWNFMTVRNWGEGSAGTWVLRVTDKTPGNAGVFNHASITINGVVDPAAPISQKPLLISSMIINGTEGQALQYKLETLGATSVAVGALPPGLSYNPGTSQITGSPTTAGVYSTPVTLTGPVETAVFNLVFSIEPLAFSLGSGVEQDSRQTISGGLSPWVFEFVQTSDGVDAVGSALGLEDGQTSVFGFDNVPQGVVLFNWKTSSEEGGDRLWFNYNGGVPIHNWESFIDGDTNWGTVAVPMPNATNRLRWTYSKNGSISVGADRGYVDQVSFVSMAKFKEDLIAAAGINFDFQQPSRTYWRPVADLSRPDSAAIRASAIGNGQKVSMTAWYDGPAELNFDYRTSSQAGDVLEVVVNSIVMRSRSGTGGPWASETVDLPAGPNFVEIRYRKNVAGFAGNDTVFLDDIKLVTVMAFSEFASGAFSSGDLGNPAISGMYANPDGDLYNNLGEYAFGGNPLVADVPKYAPKRVRSGSNQFIEFGIDPAMKDISVVAKESSNLVTWTQSYRAVFIGTQNGVDIYRIPVLGTPDELYFRLEATYTGAGAP